MAMNKEEEKYRNQKAAVIYDSDCSLCMNTVRFIRSQDTSGRFKLVGLHTDQAKKMLREHNFPFARRDTVILIRRGRLQIKSDAILGILYHLGGFWQILTIFGLIPRSVRDALYDLVQRYRYRIFGRVKHSKAKQVSRQ